jgi:cytoskeleton protein RodZ
MPSAAQARGFLRIYAEFLGIDFSDLVTSESGEAEPAPEAPESTDSEEPLAQESQPAGLFRRIRERWSRREPGAADGGAEPAEDSPQPAPGTNVEPDGKKKSLQATLTEALESTPVEPGPLPTFETGDGESGQSGPQSDQAPTPAGGNRESEDAIESRTSLQSIVSRLRGALKRLVKNPSLGPESDGQRSSLEVDADGISISAIRNARDFNPLPAEEPPGSLTSDEIFVGIGRELRARRELLSLTYEELERHTHVRALFLEALEAGAMEKLPSPVHTRGVLSNYAAFIDLDADAILLRFAEGVQARHREQRPQWPPRNRGPLTVRSTLPPLRSFIASDLIFGGGAAIMLLLFAVWGINRVMSERTSDPGQATAPSISEILGGTLPPTVVSEITFIPAQDTALVPPTVATEELSAVPPDPSITVQVTVSATERTYMRVSVDNRLQFEGRAEPGQDYYYQATREIEVVLGNAAAARVTFNGTDIGPLGSFGEVADRLFTAQGVSTPTATLSPTRTPTATPTSTTAPTPTLATYTPTPKVPR